MGLMPGFVSESPLLRQLLVFSVLAATSHSCCCRSIWCSPVGPSVCPAQGPVQSIRSLLCTTTPSRPSSDPCRGHHCLQGAEEGGGELCGCSFCFCLSLSQTVLHPPPPDQMSPQQLATTGFLRSLPFGLHALLFHRCLALHRLLMPFRLMRWRSGSKGTWRRDVCMRTGTGRRAGSRRVPELMH